MKKFAVSSKLIAVLSSACMLLGGCMLAPGMKFDASKPVDPSDPAVADTIADWAATDGTVAIRIMLNRGVTSSALHWVRGAQC